MSIKIEVRKFVNAKGHKMASIVAISGLKEKSELPDEYTQHEPCTWLVDNTKIEHTQSCPSMYINFEYEYSQIVAMMEQLKKCGDHLHQVNQQITKDIAEWTKNETYII